MLPTRCVWLSWQLQYRAFNLITVLYCIIVIVISVHADQCLQHLYHCNNTWRYSQNRLQNTNSFSLLSPDVGKNYRAKVVSWICMSTLKLHGVMQCHHLNTACLCMRQAPYLHACSHKSLHSIYIAIIKLKCHNTGMHVDIYTTMFIIMCGPGDFKPAYACMHAKRLKRLWLHVMMISLCTLQDRLQP